MQKRAASFSQLSRDPSKHPHALPGPHRTVMVQAQECGPHLLPSRHVTPSCGKDTGLYKGDNVPLQSSSSLPWPWLLSAVGEAVSKYHPGRFWSMQKVLGSFQRVMGDRTTSKTQKQRENSTVKVFL